MNSLTDLILELDGATMVFFGTLLASAATLIFALHSSATFRPDPISQPMSSSPRLLQGPQLLGEGRSQSEFAALGLFDSELTPELDRWPIAVVSKPVYVEMTDRRQMPK